MMNRNKGFKVNKNETTNLQIKLWNVLIAESINTYMPSSL